MRSRVLSCATSEFLFGVGTTPPPPTKSSTKRRRSVEDDLRFGNTIIALYRKDGSIVDAVTVTSEEMYLLYGYRSACFNEVVLMPDSGPGRETMRLAWKAKVVVCLLKNAIARYGTRARAIAALGLDWNWYVHYRLSFRRCASWAKEGATFWARPRRRRWRKVKRVFSVGVQRKRSRRHA